MAIIFYPIISALFALAFAWFLAMQIKRTNPFSFEGSALRYGRIHRKASIVAAVVAVICFFFIGLQATLGFLIGTVIVLLLDLTANHLLHKATMASPEIAKRGLEKAFDMLIKNSLSVALLAVSLAILTISGYYWIFNSLVGCIGICTAASLVTLFLGMTKSPTFKTVATFQTYSITMVATMLLGEWLYPSSLQFTLLPLALSAASLLAMILASFFASVTEKQSAATPFYKFVAASFVLSIFASYFIISGLMQDTAISVWYLSFCATIGSAAAGICALATNNSQNKAKRFVLTILVLAIGIAAAYFLATFYGIAILALGALSAAAAMGSMGLLNATAKGLGNKLAPEAVDQKQTANALESAAKQTGSAILLYEIITAGLTAIAALLAFFSEVSIRTNVNLMQQYPYLIGGFVIGVLLPYLFYRLAKDSTAPKDVSLAIIIPAALLIAFGYIFGPVALLALLAGAIISGILLASLETTTPAMNSLIQTLPIAALLIISFLI
jgi:Na+/H+-translocating membrane pyrophosphatase